MAAGNYLSRTGAYGIKEELNNGPYTKQVLFFDNDDKHIYSSRICRNIQAIYCPEIPHKFAGGLKGEYGLEKYTDKIMELYPDNGYAKAYKHFLSLIPKSERDHIVTNGMTIEQMDGVIQWARNKDITGRKAILLDFDRTLSVIEGSIITIGKAAFEQYFKDLYERENIKGNKRDIAIFAFGGEERVRKLKEMFDVLKQEIGTDNVYIVTANGGIAGTMNEEDRLFNRTFFMDAIDGLFGDGEFLEENLLSTIPDRRYKSFALPKGMFFKEFLRELCDGIAKGGRKGRRTRKSRGRKAKGTRKSKGRKTRETRKSKGRKTRKTRKK